ncbi:hypothetical protein SAMN05421830_12047 [Desulfomicrobium norvegicum]|uniref:Uncharacterized protein n=1 Tax=Desulfomicrobium norvegicum (strain DSM 1741 / NCIMB 8310) TaxID=52561 RepID=A0A8G2C651_DESNO|nr:hypothetical protein [Desulfomicrobium norvegicum]SFM20508.1 hypothetical protein SAMN05421830_12047 [Desulfomicrobium norvegicum]
MNSIAVWWTCKKNQLLSDIKIHLDINIWLSKNKEFRYIEFGIKIKNYEKIKQIHIYLPYVIEKKDIEDKIKILAENTNITNALFNKKTTISNGGGIFHEVKMQGEDPFHYITLSDKFFKTCPYKVGEKVTGTQITITSHPSKENPVINGYYRFRINKITDTVKTISQNFGLTNGFYNKVDFVEININSARKLPNDIVESIGECCKFESMNLFLITDLFTEFKFISKEINASRILENDIWNQYIIGSRKENKKIKDTLRLTAQSKIIAHHWKKTDFSDYSLFLKTDYSFTNLKIIIMMIISLLIFGTISSLFANYASFHLLDESPNQIEEPVNIQTMEIGNGTEK